MNLFDQVVNANEYLKAAGVEQRNALERAVTANARELRKIRDANRKQRSLTCAVCWAAFKSRREIHSQNSRFVCCRCLGHAYGTCWPTEDN